MSRNLLIALAVVVVIIAVGMIVSMRKTMETGGMARDPDATPPKTQPAPKK